MLPIDAIEVIIVRIAPQNPPHMVSKDKRTEFFGRYDATSERMRYEEIEQRFRDKHGTAEIISYGTPKTVIDSTLGRTEVSEGAKGFLEETIATIMAGGEPTFALVAASDGNDGSISDNDAVRFFKEPLYSRTGGWLVTHRELDVDFRSGVWEQRYGSYSLTTVTPSGDLIFKKPVDEVLCWTQPKLDFFVAPRLYPNGVVEYCLSFAYVLADIMASSRPARLLIVPLIAAGGAEVKLPLGEGGSIWFNAQIASANTIIEKKSVGRPILEVVTSGQPILPRNLAFRLAAQVYSFFGYNPREVPFASKDEVTVEPDADTATLISLRTYLRDTLLADVSPPREDFNRGCFMFALELGDGRHVFWVSEEFVNDHHWEEARLFALLDSLKLAEWLRGSNRKDKLLLSNDGIVPLPT